MTPEQEARAADRESTRQSMVNDRIGVVLGRHVHAIKWTGKSVDDAKITSIAEATDGELCQLYGHPDAFPLDKPLAARARTQLPPYHAMTYWQRKAELRWFVADTKKNPLPDFEAECVANFKEWAVAPPSPEAHGCPSCKSELASALWDAAEVFRVSIGLRPTCPMMAALAAPGVV